MYSMITWKELERVYNAVRISQHDIETHIMSSVTWFS